MLVEDEHRRIALTNAAFCRMFGIPAPPEALVGTDCSQATQQSKALFADPDGFVAGVEAILAAGLPVTGERLDLADGRVLERDFIPVVDGERPTGLLWKYRDVTEQVRAEARVVALRRFYERVLDAMPIQLAVFEAQGATYQYVTRRAITDPVLREWIIGKTDVEYAVHRGIDAAVAEQRRARVLEAARTHEESRFEETLYARNGEARHFARFVTPVRDADGVTDLVLGFGLDITERVEAEERLREATRAAEASAQAKEAFLANMSHEIRTPLNAVVGTTHLLESTPLSDEQRALARAIRTSSDALLALISDILDLTKIGSGHISFEALPFAPRGLVGSLGDALRATALHKGLELHVEVAPRVPAAVVGDARRLNQVLLNLVGNAIKFTERGRIALTVDAEPGAGDAVTLRFQVRDTGIGIAGENLGVIFDAFTQERSDTTRRFGGTGLGLAIVRELVTRQGGRVEVESEPGRGSTFTVTLPAMIGVLPADPDAAEAGGSGRTSLAGTRILLVEDNEMNQFVAREMLRRAGATVEVAGNGRLALDRLREDRAFDVVLMDLQMPEMDGFEATRRIRDDLRIPEPELPILALTASALVDQRRRAAELGMTDFVMKPFEPEQLLRRIAAAVRRDGRPVTPAVAPAVPAPADALPPAIDHAVLESQTLGDVAFAAQMIDLYLQHEPAQRADLYVGVSSGDAPALRAAAHKLKSAAGVVGARRLGALLQAMEHDGGQLPPDARHALAREIDDEADRVRRELAQLRAGMAAA